MTIISKIGELSGECDAYPATYNENVKRLLAQLDREHIAKIALLQTIKPTDENYIPLA